MNTGKEKGNTQVGRVESNYQERLKVGERIDNSVLHCVTLFSKFCLYNPI